MAETESTQDVQETSSQSAPETVRETLSKVLAGEQIGNESEGENNAENDKEDKGTSEEPDEQTDGEEATDEPGEDGDTSEEETEDRAEAEDGEEEEEKELKPLDPPKHWAKEFKEQFNQLDPSGQKMFMDRYKDLESDYTKKTQHLAQYRKRQEALDGIIKPFMGDFERAGMDDVGAIRQLFAAHDYLKKDPKSAITWLAQNYGVNLSEVGLDQSEEDDYSDPQVKDLKQQVAQLSGLIQQQQNQQMQSVQNSTQSMIDQFANEKNTDGSIKYPHFDNVRETMGVLIQNNKAKDLASAYDMAVYADPQLRQDLINRETVKKNENAVKSEAVKKAKKAQRSTVRGSATPSEKTLPDNLTIRETINQSIKQLEGR